jgi:hypothetical protein
MCRIARLIGIATISFLISNIVAAQAPLNNATAGTGSVSGQIMCGGKPIARLRLGLQFSQVNGPTPHRRYTKRTQTDVDRRYQFIGVAPGQYTFLTFSANCVIAGDPRLFNLGKQCGRGYRISHS